MKLKNMLMPMILVIVFTAAIFGQTARETKKKTIMKKDDISRTLGRPVFARTADSLNTRVWIITQQRNREIMKTKVVKMKDTDTKVMDKPTKEAMMEGNYFIILDVTNTSSGKEFADSSAKVSIVSPTQKVTSATLYP